MPSIARYRGDQTENLLAMSEANHLFGPDMTGDRGLRDDEIGHAMRTGLYDMLRRIVEGGVLPAGAYYTIHEAEYDPVTDLTTATFRPYVDPRQRLRNYGGDAVLDETPTLRGRDDIKPR